MIYRIIEFNHKEGTAKETSFSPSSLYKYFKPVRKGNNIKELNNIVTLDTETTSDIANNRGFINTWTMTLDGTTFRGDTPRELFEFIDQMNKIVKRHKFNMKCGRTGKNVATYFKGEKFELKQPLLRIYIHNLGYDWTYLRLYKKEFETFGGSDTSPINIFLPDDFVVFYDSLKLFDKSLKALIKDYSLDYYEYKDNWDYKKYRVPGDSLTEKELYYVASDTSALHDILKLKRDREPYNGDLSKIPSTKTGEVRHMLEEYNRKQDAIETNQKRFKKYFQNSAIVNKPNLKNYAGNARYILNTRNNKVYEKYAGQYKVINQYRYDCLLMYGARLRSTKAVYEEMIRYSQEAFAGGFTHANRHYLGILAKKVYSGDERSAYPAMCFQERFGLSWRRGKVKFLRECSRKKLYLVIARIKGLHTTNNKDGHFTTISEHKILKTDPITQELYTYKGIETDNGRIFKADECVVCMYADELNTLNHRFYEWDELEIIKSFEAEAEYLPRSILVVTAYYYSEKTRLKEELKQIKDTYGEDSEEYRKTNLDMVFAKQQLNSIYGCLATNPLKYVEKVDEEGKPLTTEQYEERLHDKILELFDKKTTCLDFVIGPQITMLNRVAIFNIMHKIGIENVLYSDTDSVKFLVDNVKNWEEIFEEYNTVYREIVKKTISDNMLDVEGWKSNGEILYPGEIEVDGKYPEFKTIGAKAYVYTEISKKTGKKELHATVAGISKKKMVEHLLQGDPDNFVAAFRRFNTNIKVDKTSSGKKVHKYHRELNEIKKWDDGIESGWWIEIDDSEFDRSLNPTKDVFKMIKRNLGIARKRRDVLIDN